MPSIITHYLLGDMVIQNLPDSRLKKIILENHQVFNLGTQGPDILFYYRVWPWTRSLDIPQVGNKMHEENVSAFFQSALMYLHEKADHEKNLLTAYLFGYICHYSLDAQVHPYIFYRSGFTPADAPLELKYNCYHRIFETAIDVLMLKHLRNLKPADIHPHKLISIKSQEAEGVGEMYEYILKTAYDISITANQIRAAIKDMIRVQAVILDPSGWKKKAFYSLETLSGGLPMISSMIHPPEIRDGLDYLNESHRPWALPWDCSALDSSSFTELFLLAVNKAVCYCTTFYKCISGEILAEEAIRTIGNSSFSTGLNCDLSLPFHHFDCIFEE